MTPLECPREAEVMDAVAAHRWPDRLDDGLRAHLAACALCRDLAEVADAFQHEREASWTEASSLPPADIVWVRAQARARADATRDAARPIAIMQALGLASAAAVLSVLIGIVAYWVWTRADLLERLPTADPAGLDVMGLAIRGVLLAVGFWLVLAPVAVYLAALDD